MIATRMQNYKCLSGRPCCSEKKDEEWLNQQVIMTISVSIMMMTGGIINDNCSGQGPIRACRPSRCHLPSR